MSRKTYFMEKDGIRVDGFANKTEANKAWIAARDDFAKRAAECSPWIFNYSGHVLVVAPNQYGWEYTIVRPNEAQGVRNVTCSFGARSHVAAIASALGALVQNVWTRDCPDDAGLFDAMVKAARIFPGEAKEERSQFLHVAAHWRSTPAAA